MSSNEASPGTPLYIPEDSNIPPGLVATSAEAMGQLQAWVGQNRHQGGQGRSGKTGHDMAIAGALKCSGSEHCSGPSAVPRDCPCPGPKHLLRKEVLRAAQTGNLNGVWEGQHVPATELHGKGGPEGPWKPLC